jgi:hypothetical protein
MRRLKKITVQVPAELLERAQKDGEGITETVRQALELRANQEAWAALRKWRGKIKWSIDYKTMKYDR